MDSDKIANDYEYSRQTYYELIEKGKDALDLADSAAAGLVAFVSDSVLSDTSIFRFLKRCRGSDGVAREK